MLNYGKNDKYVLQVISSPKSPQSFSPLHKSVELMHTPFGHSNSSGPLQGSSSSSIKKI